MSPRTAGIAFLLAAGLFAFIYFYEIRGEDARLEAEQAEKRLFPELEADAVEAVAFTPAGSPRIRLERRDRGWQLREPLEFPADEFAADGMAAALADLTRQQVLADPQPPETYGLGESALEIAFEAGGEERRIRIGAAAPMGSNTYLAIDGDPAVYTVASFGVNALRKGLDELRDKRVTHFDQAAIDRIEASWPGGGVVLSRDEEGWRLLEPLQDAADTLTVDSLLTDLSFLRATGFQDAPPPDAESGLDAPDFAVTLTGAAAVPSDAEAGEADTEAEEPDAEAGETGGEEVVGGGEPVEVRIAIGRALDEGERLVRSGATSLYRIPADRISDFPRELVAYRFKELARFQAADAARVKVVFQRLVSSEEGDAPVEVVATRGDTGWSTGAGGFRPGKVASLVSELSRLRGEDILVEEPDQAALAEWDLAPPRTQISVYGEGDALLARVELGRAREDGALAARAGDGGRIYALAAEIGEYVPVDLDAFRSRFQAEEGSAAPVEEPEEGATGTPGAETTPPEEDFWPDVDEAP